MIPFLERYPKLEKTTSEYSINLDPFAPRFPAPFYQFLQNLCPNLTHLNLVHFPGYLPKVHSENLLKGFPKLTSLEIDLGETQIRSSEAASILAKHHPQLSSLSIKNFSFNEEEAITLLQGVQHLKKINLQLNRSILHPEQIFNAIASTPLAELTHLRIGYCFGPLISNSTSSETTIRLNNSFKALFKVCHKLVDVDLSSFPCVDDETIEVLVKNCPSLQHVNLESCSSLTFKSLKLFIENSPNLRRLAYNIKDSGDKNAAFYSEQLFYKGIVRYYI